MTTTLSKILIVDDRQSNLVAMKKLLTKVQADVYTASSGNEALSLIIDNDFALILLDVQMPEMDGFETAQIMRSSAYANATPIIFVTAISKDEHHVFQGYDSGAVDYMLKPVEPRILLSKVAVFLELYEQKQELIAAKIELTRQTKILEELAIHDDLTGLHNRRHLNTILQQEFVRSQRYNTDLSCLMLDLDHFKDINDTYGHGFGDLVLQTFAVRIKESIRVTDFAFRFGGEEFLVLLPQTNIDGAHAIAQKIRLLNEKSEFTSGEQRVRVTLSGGLTSFLKDQPQERNDLLTMADKALYVAKKNGRNRIEIFTP